MISFPQGFRCTPEFNARYAECHPQFQPFIERKAAMVARWAPQQLDVQDMYQEGCMALLRALIDYDENRTDANLKAYVGRTVDNHFRSMFWSAVAQCRMPRGYIRDYDGDWKQRRIAPMSLDAMLSYQEEHGGKPGKWWMPPPSDEPTPAEVAMDGHLAEEAKRFRMKLLNTLDPKSKAVFQAKFNPTTDMLKMLDNEGVELDPNRPEIPNVAVAKITGYSKAVIDHCMYKIRDRFRELAKDIDFSDLFGDVVGSKGWPMIHINDAEGHNKEFIRRVMKRRNLGMLPLPGWDAEPDHFQRGKNCARWVERYSWGIVMVLQYEGEWRTLVMEGERVNLNTGAVFGSYSVQEELTQYIPWYRDLVKRLKAAEKEARHG